MKTKELKWLAMAGLMAGLAMPALGQDEEKPNRPDRPERPQRGQRPGGPDAGGGERPTTIMAALDRNRDGVLDQNEIDMSVVVLRRMDRDQDGKVTAEEVAAGPQFRPQGGQGGPGGRPGGDRPGGQAGRGPSIDMFARLDTDGDGKISKEEAPDRMAQNFDQIDGNSDGFIDKKEQEQLIEMMRRRFREGGQRPGGGQGRRPEPGAGEGGTDKPKRPGSE